MQFEMHKKYGELYTSLTFKPHKVQGQALVSVIETLLRLGGKMGDTVSEWKLPYGITKEAIQQVIANTCFVCGGLMKDSERIGNLTTELPVKKVKIRRCSICGHSHT